MFETAKLKHEWANKHIANLRSAFNDFARTSSPTISTRSDPGTGDVALEWRFDKPIPPTIALMLGDIVHNFRGALDHAAWELVGLDGGTQDRSLYFPVKETKQNFDTACNQIKTPRADTKSFFQGFEAYKGGNNVILASIASATSISIDF
jgi:hypothetical protein